MNDKTLGVLSFLSLVVVVVVIAINWNGATVNDNFAYGKYYIPSVSNKKTDEASLYASMINSKSSTDCTVQELEGTNEGVIYTSSLGSEYPHTNYILSTKALFGESHTEALTYNGWDDSSTMYGLKTMFKWTEAASNNDSYNLYIEDESGFNQILAPFPFNFISTNTEGNTITIVDTSGKVRITFTNVANWFCAGQPVADSSADVSENLSYNSWLSHGTPHGTIIGATANAEVKSGTAGVIIGYANYSTEVTVEVLKDGGYKTISLYEWLTK